MEFLEFPRGLIFDNVQDNFGEEEEDPVPSKTAYHFPGEGEEEEEAEEEAEEKERPRDNVVVNVVLVNLCEFFTESPFRSIILSACSSFSCLTRIA